MRGWCLLKGSRPDSHPNISVYTTQHGPIARYLPGPDVYLTYEEAFCILRAKALAQLGRLKAIVGLREFCWTCGKDLFCEHCKGDK